MWVYSLFQSGPDSSDSCVEQYFDPFQKNDAKCLVLGDLDGIHLNPDSSPLDKKEFRTLNDPSEDFCVDQYHEESSRRGTIFRESNESREGEHCYEPIPIPDISPDLISYSDLEARFIDDFSMGEFVFEDSTSIGADSTTGDILNGEIDAKTRNTRNKPSILENVQGEKRAYEQTSDLDTRSTANETQREERPHKRKQLLCQNSKIVLTTTDISLGETSLTLNIKSKSSQPGCLEQTSKQVKKVQFNSKENEEYSRVDDASSYVKEDINTITTIATTRRSSQSQGYIENTDKALLICSNATDVKDATTNAKDIADENKANSRDTYVAKDINTITSSTTRRSSPLKDGGDKTDKTLLTSPIVTVVKDDTNNIRRSLVSSTEATAISVLSNFDVYSKKRNTEHLYDDVHKPTQETSNTEIASTDSSLFLNETNRELLQKFDTILEPKRKKHTRSVDYKPSEESWLASFEHAKRVLEEAQDFTSEEEKKVKNWLQNQCKTKKRRPEYMNEKLFSLGEIAYSNSIMLQKWKQNRKHPACKRWRKTMFRCREKLDNDIKDLLVRNKVFQLKEFQVSKKNPQKKQKNQDS